MQTSTAVPFEEPKPVETVAMQVLIALSFSHLLNDTLQSLIPSIYPMLKENYSLTFTQIGLITFTYQVTASLLQPLVGLYTDKKPLPYSLPVGMGITLLGLGLLAIAHNFHALLVAAAFVGTGSSIFHPEASRVARMASGGRHGFAQSLFQVGGNLGSSLGPLLAALIIMRRGQISLLWFSVLALAGIILLQRVGGWYKRHLSPLKPKPRAAGTARGPALSRGRIAFAMTILMALVFSKYFYLISLTNYYTFYLIGKFNMTAQHAQLCLFVFLFAVAAGTIIGGPLGDRFGRKYIIWISILGVTPFTLIMPHVGLAWTIALSAIIGGILASAFSAILVYAQELVPGKVGLVAGLFFGLAFGISGVASATLGKLIDHTSINYVFGLCAYLPLIGLVTGFLPNLDARRRS